MTAARPPAASPVGQRVAPLGEGTAPAAAARTEPGPLSEGTAAYPFDPPVTGPQGELRWSDLVFSCEPGYRPLMLDLRVPAGAPAAGAPVVVWLHGGAWMHGSRRRRAPHLHAHRIIEAMVDAGFAVALADYRLAAEVAFPGPVLDVLAAVRWLRGSAAVFGLDPDRVALWGESAGAHLALLAGLGRRTGTPPRTGDCLDQPEDVTAVIDWYGPADLPALDDGPDADPAADTRERDGADPFRLLIRGTDRTLADLSPIRYVRPGGPAVLLAHGIDDELVPVAQSRALHSALVEARADVEYLETAGGHVFVGADVLPEVTARSIDFLHRRFAAVRVAGSAPGKP